MAILNFDNIGVAGRDGWQRLFLFKMFKMFKVFKVFTHKKHWTLEQIEHGTSTSTKKTNEHTHNQQKKFGVEW